MDLNLGVDGGAVGIPDHDSWCIYCRYDFVLVEVGGEIE